MPASVGRKSEAPSDTFFDGYIAATAAARGLMVATRDTGSFEAAGLALINPWEI